MQEYKIIRARRKTVSLSVTMKHGALVRAPLKMPLHEIEKFVQKHEDWLLKHIAAMEKRREAELDNPLDEEKTAELINKAREFIPQRVSYYSALMGVSPTGIKITAARARYGSCNHKNGLCFAYRVMLLPDRLIDYIVVHELAHIEEKNHQKAFYEVIALYMPDYKDRVAELKSLAKYEE